MKDKKLYLLNAGEYDDNEYLVTEIYPEDVRRLESDCLCEISIKDARKYKREKDPYKGIVGKYKQFKLELIRIQKLIDGWSQEKWNKDMIKYGNQMAGISGVPCPPLHIDEMKDEKRELQHFIRGTKRRILNLKGISKQIKKEL